MADINYYDEDSLVKYFCQEFSKNKGLETQVDEIIQMTSELRGTRKYQYWSHEQFEFLQEKFNNQTHWTKKEKI